VRRRDARERARVDAASTRRRVDAVTLRDASTRRVTHVAFHVARRIA